MPHTTIAMTFAFIMYPIYPYEKRTGRARHKLDCTFTREYDRVRVSRIRIRTSVRNSVKAYRPNHYVVDTELVGYRNVSSIFIISTDRLAVCEYAETSAKSGHRLDFISRWNVASRIIISCIILFAFSIGSN